MSEQNNNHDNSEATEVRPEVRPEEATEHEETVSASVSVDDEQDTNEDSTGEADTFDRAYVEKLRAEAAEHRVKAKEFQDMLEAMQDRYRTLAVEHAATGVLSRPEALEWRDEWNKDDGTADVAAIREAALQYADKYPHAAVVAGDVGQGYRGEAVSSVDLAGMLRSGA